MTEHPSNEELLDIIYDIIDLTQIRNEVLYENFCTAENLLGLINKIYERASDYYK